MRKIKFLFAFVVAALFLASCDKKIEVISNITSNETWTSNNQYIISGDITVDNGAILTIEPGTKIEFSAGYGLYVNDGTLIAEGTEDKPIIFTSNATVPTKGAWVGLVFYEGTLQNTSLKYCEIKYAGGSQNLGAIHIQGCKIAINNCTIENTKYNGIYLLYETADFVTFTNNTIKDVDNHALVLTANAIPSIGTNNTFTTPDGYGIEVQGGHFKSGNQSWKKQTCDYYVSYEVQIDGTSTVTIEPGTVIKFNSGINMNVGYASNGTLVAEGTADLPIVFTSSASSPTAGAWTGLLFYGYSTSSKLKYCTIEYAGSQSYSGAVYIDDCLVSFDNCTIKNNDGYGIYNLGATSGFSSFTNNTLTDNSNHAIRILAELVHTIGAGNTFTCPEYKGIEINGGHYVNNSKTWLKHNVPYYVTYSPAFDGSLTIQAGCEFKCDAGVWFEFGYTSNTSVSMVGASDNKIKFTSSASSPAVGSWGGLYFYENSNCTLNHVNIMYGGSSNGGTVMINDGVTLNMSNTDIQYSESCAIYYYGTVNIVGSGNTYSNNNGNNICF